MLVPDLIALISNSMSKLIKTVAGNIKKKKIVTEQSVVNVKTLNSAIIFTQM